MTFYGKQRFLMGTVHQRTLHPRDSHMIKLKCMPEFLLIPAMPTPNGALHLGHIGTKLKLNYAHL